VREASRSQLELLNRAPGKKSMGKSQDTLGKSQDTLGEHVDDPKKTISGSSWNRETFGNARGISDDFDDDQDEKSGGVHVIGQLTTLKQLQGGAAPQELLNELEDLQRVISASSFVLKECTDDWDEEKQGVAQQLREVFHFLQSEGIEGSPKHAAKSQAEQITSPTFRRDGSVEAFYGSPLDTDGSTGRESNGDEANTTRFDDGSNTAAQNQEETVVKDEDLLNELLRQNLVNSQLLTQCMTSVQARSNNVPEQIPLWSGSAGTVKSEEPAELATEGIRRR